eukprot:6022324-Pyramimonas_sp.AAC.1
MQFTTNSSEVAKLAPAALGANGHTVAGHVLNLGLDRGKIQGFQGRPTNDKSGWNKGLRRLTL